MSKRLMCCILQCGADNIEHFPVTIRGDEAEHAPSYHAVNIVGLIAAANEQSRQWTITEDQSYIDVEYKQLVLDEDKIPSVPIFRLAEDTSAIIVHEMVRRAIIETKINTVTFISPEKWTTRH